MNFSSPQRFLLLFNVIIFLILANHIDSTILPRGKDVIGLTGRLTLFKRFADAIGTSVQSFSNGPQQIYAILQSPLHSPISAIYSSAISPPESCGSESEDKRCGTGLKNFGGIGEVHYEFFDPRRNIKGKSTQSFLACRCLPNRECNSSILLRPIALKGTTNEICMYEARRDPTTGLPMFSDCFAAALQIQSIPESKLPYNKFDPWTYEVHHQNKDGRISKWSAFGSRGWLRNCTKEEIDDLPRVNISELTDKNVSRNTHDTPAEGSPCKPPEGFIYFIDESDEDGSKCATAYSYAQAAAANAGSQADNIAIGRDEKTYANAKPNLITPTDISLAISAAGLGLLVLFTRFQKQRKKTYDTWTYLIAVVFMHILLYGFEGLPLQIALGMERAGMAWTSYFAHLDVTLSLGEEQTSVQGSSNGSVLIIQTIFGNVRVIESKEMWLKVALILSDVIAVILVILTLATRCVMIRHLYEPEKVFSDEEGDNINIEKSQENRGLSTSTLSSGELEVEKCNNIANMKGGHISETESAEGAEINTLSPIQRLKVSTSTLFSDVIGLTAQKSYRS